jgi:hypothetical protein
MLRHTCGYKLANDGHDTRSLQAYLGIETFKTPRATPRSHRIGSKPSGGIDRAALYPCCRLCLLSAVLSLSGLRRLRCDSGRR